MLYVFVVVAVGSVLFLGAICGVLVMKVRSNRWED